MIPNSLPLQPGAAIAARSALTGRHPVALAVAALLLAAGAAQAQDAGPVTGDSQARPTQRLDRVEVIGRQQSDTDLRRRAQVAKQVYGREELDKYGDNNVADVMKRLPGITMQGNSPRMRGLGSGYTLLLINGDPAPPGFALDQLNPAQIERIEVTKGPTADQSAQAVAGTINIIMKEAPKQSQRDLRLQVGYNADRPTLAGNFTYGEKLGDGLSVLLPVSLFEWRGENNFVNRRFMPGLDGQFSDVLQAGHQPYWGHGINSAPRLTWRVSDDETVSLQAFVQRGNWNVGTDYVNTILIGQPSLDDPAQAHGSWQNVRGNLQWVTYMAGDRRLEIKAGLGSSKGTFNNQTYRDGNPERHAYQDNGDISLTQAGKYTQLVNEAHSVTVGWDLEWRRRDEKRTVTELGLPQLPGIEGQPFSARVDRGALFIQDEWEVTKQFSTYIGLRSERIESRSLGVDLNVDNTSSVLTPLWHITYKLDPAGKDMIRASLTRSYKAPDLGTLMARPTVSGLFTDLSKTNTELSPDRIGNPDLQPELATGLDAAYEKYLPTGGMFSIGMFYRHVNNLIRSVTTLQTVSYATAPRWVSSPTNFASAQTAGLELEVKGRAGELMPSLFNPKLGLNLRASLNFYRSSVDGLPGPNNRLDGQQPWQGTFGFDHRFATMPMVLGSTMTFAPGYLTQQTSSQTLEQSRTRGLDVYAQWVFSKTLSMRVSANNAVPVDTWSQTLVGGGYGSTTTRSGRTNYAVGIEMKL
jgi:iron complex outermembrane receptor protein